MLNQTHPCLAYSYITVLELLSVEMSRPEGAIIIISPDILLSIIQFLQFLQFLHFCSVIILQIYTIIRERIRAIHFRTLMPTNDIRNKLLHTSVSLIISQSGSETLKMIQK